MVIVVVLRTATGMPALGLLFGAVLVCGARHGRVFKTRMVLAVFLAALAIWLGRRDGSLLAVLMGLLALAQWRANILGGADVQIQLLLMALFPTLTMVWLMLLVPIVFRLLYLRRGRRGRQPMIPAYALAGLLQIWIAV